MKKRFFEMTIICVSILFCISCNTYRKVGSENKADSLVGVWRQVSRVSAGGNGVEITKIITENHFFVTTVSEGIVKAAFGGTYSVDGNTLIETVEFGTPNRKHAIGKSLLNYKFENGNLHLSWQMKRGEYTIWDKEIWERVE